MTDDEERAAAWRELNTAGWWCVRWQFANREYFTGALGMRTVKHVFVARGRFQRALMGMRKAYVG